MEITLLDHLRKFGFEEQMLDLRFGRARLGVYGGLSSPEACFEPFQGALRRNDSKKVPVSAVLILGMKVQFATPILRETFEHSPRWFVLIVRLWDFFAKSRLVSSPVFQGWVSGATNEKTFADFPFDRFMTFVGMSGFGSGLYVEDDGTIWKIDHGALSNVRSVKVLYQDGKPTIDIEWFCIAAEKGNTRALVLLAYFYHQGHGVLRDDVRAVMWSILAAENGEESVIRDVLAPQMAPEHLAEAHRLAREWLEKHSK